MLTGKQRSASSQFRWLPTVDESFARMLRCISEAKESLRLEMYIYTASPIGERFRAALVEACGRGVEVRVLVDAWGSMTLSDRFWDSLRAAGGQFRWFNPITLGRCGFRNHRKLLVCDGEVAFVGGFNIGPEYQGDGVTRGWHDFGMQVQGRLAEELGATFDALYEMADSKHPRFTRLRKAWARRSVATPDGEILMTGPGRGRSFLKQTLLNDLGQAAEIRIVSAYFLPTRPIRRALLRAAKRGASVKLILAGKSDVPISQFAIRRFYQAFLRAGIEIYEYQPQVLHGKLLILDDVTYAGSANLDRRSFFINYELMLRVRNAELAAEAEAMFSRDLKRCVKIELRDWEASRTIWGRLKESWAFFVLGRLDPFIARWQLKNLR